DVDRLRRRSNLRGLPRPFILLRRPRGAFEPAALQNALHLGILEILGIGCRSLRCRIKPARIHIGQRSIEHIAVWVPALPGEWRPHDRIGRQEPPYLRIKNPSFHVDEPEFVIALVPGESLRCKACERRWWRLAPRGVSPLPERVVAPALDHGAALVRERVD